MCWLDKMNHIQQSVKIAPGNFIFILAIILWSNVWMWMITLLASVRNLLFLRYILFCYVQFSFEFFLYSNVIDFHFSHSQEPIREYFWFSIHLVWLHIHCGLVFFPLRLKHIAFHTILTVCFQNKVRYSTINRIQYTLRCAGISSRIGMRLLFVE